MVETEGERRVERGGGRHSWPRDVLSNTVTLRPMMLLWERGRDGGGEKGRERGRERGREAQLA